MVILTLMALAVPIFLTSEEVYGQTAWERTLQDGHRVRIDPSTGKGRLIRPDGTEIMLWDGVHRLENGRALIVHDGIVVPDTAMAEARRAPRRDVGPSLPPCAMLERRTCGLYAECANTEGCLLAQQLARLEAASDGAGPHAGGSSTSVQCREAVTLSDTFPACTNRSPGQGATACSALADRVCGKTRACARTEPCRAALQLVEMEYEELFLAADTAAATHTTRQCEEAMGDATFFVPCPLSAQAPAR